MKPWLVLLVVLVALSPLGATTYFVSNCAGADSGTVGSDTNNGTASNTPWLTVAKVNSSSFAAGDTISFHKGCTWREKLVVPSSGSAGNPVTFGAYGAGAKPILNGSTVVNSGSWTLTSGSIYQTTISWGPFGFEAFEDGTVMVKAASQGAMVAGTFFESGTTLFVWTFDGSNPSGHSLEVSQLSGENDGLVAIIAKNFITLDGLDIQKSNWIGVYLRAASNVTVQNSSFEYTYWNSISEDEQTSGANWLFAASDHVNVLNNTFSNDGQSRLTTNHSQEGVAVQGLGWQTCLISGNTVDSNLGEGLVVMGGADSCSMSSNSVTNNKFASIYVLSGPNGGDTTNTTVQYNYVTTVPNSTPAYVIAPEGGNHDNINGVNFSYNIANCNNSSAFYALRFGGSGGNGVWENVRVYNNTLSCPYGIDIVSNGPSGPGNDIENNIIKSTNFQTFLTSDTATSNYTIGYEDIFTPLSTAIKWSTGTTYTLATFQAAFPCPANPWFCNSVQADPTFTNAAGGDFTLLTGSPAINAGTNLGGTYQNALDPATVFPWSTVNQNLYGSGWEMGAFVYGSATGAPGSTVTGNAKVTGNTVVQ